MYEPATSTVSLFVCDRILGAKPSHAELNSDVQVLENMLADDYIGFGPLGFILTKEQWLERHASGALTYTSFVVEVVKLRIYKDAAIAIGHEAAQESYKGQSMPGNFRITLIFV